MKKQKYIEASQTEYNLVWKDTDEYAGVTIARLISRKKVKNPWAVMKMNRFGRWDMKSQHSSLASAKKSGYRYATREP